MVAAGPSGEQNRDHPAGAVNADGVITSYSIHYTKLYETKPFGFMPFYPGPGIGGHCIPLDPFYLSWKAKQYGFESRFIELAGVINGQMPHYRNNFV